MRIRPQWHTLVALLLALGSQVPQALGAQARKTAPPPGAPDISKMPKTPKIPEGFDALFAERDKRAMGAVGYFACMQATVTALRAGTLGQVARDWSITCIEQAGEWRGVFGSLRDGTIDVQRQFALRGSGSGVVTTDPVDTARVNGSARALLRGLSAPLPGAGKYEYTPVPLVQDKFIEVWFLPVPTSLFTAVVGGDSLIQMSADGVRELGHGRSTPVIRPMSVPVSATTWSLQSREERIPTVSELVLARLALVRVPEVRVQTYQYESVLTKRGWTHRRK
jgi:hypothetical protein